MNLKKCPSCKTYTLKESCPKCSTETKNPNYKFIQIRDAPKDSEAYFDKKRKLTH